MQNLYIFVIFSCDFRSFYDNMIIDHIYIIKGIKIQMNKRLAFIPFVFVILFLMYLLMSLETSASGDTFKSVLFQKDSLREAKPPVKVKDFKIPDIIPDISKPDYVVVIDAGHGGNDSGSSDNGVIEKEVTLDIALKLNSILKSEGIRTHMIRTTDIFIDHRDRINTANEMNASLYISIHCNWFNDRTLLGTQTLYYPSASLAIGELKELKYASIIQTELIKTINTKNRGIDDRADLAVLRRANMPSVLVELAFMSNPADAQKLLLDDFRKKAAEGLAEGLKKSLAGIEGN
ncbi:MAG: hypothetical protein K0R31_227 [Clostridiales bacterium]|nr:hypothetical protein [Clostridiales bacterium]